MTIIDLSVPLNNSTPAFPGDPRIAIEQTGDVATLGYQGHQVSLATHTGTHVDAPSHMIEGGLSLADIPLGTFYGQAKTFSVQGDLYHLPDEDLDQIKPGDIVLLHTGTSERLHDSSYFTDYPVMSEELASALVSKMVKLVGVDTCSADKGGIFTNHHILLGANIPIIENLTNLQELASKTCTFYGFPIRLEEDGAPLRAVAEITE